MAVVEGRLQNRDWTDRDGNKRRSTEIIADNVYFGDSKPKENGEGEPPAYGDDPLAGVGNGFDVPPGFAPDFGSDEGGELSY